MPFSLGRPEGVSPEDVEEARRVGLGQVNGLRNPNQEELDLVRLMG